MSDATATESPIYNDLLYLLSCAAAPVIVRESPEAIDTYRQLERDGYAYCYIDIVSGRLFVVRSFEWESARAEREWR